MIDLDSERRRRRSTPRRPASVPRPFDARLSALIDGATVELDAAADAATVAKWRDVLAALTDRIPR